MLSQVPDFLKPSLIPDPTGSSQQPGSGLGWGLAPWLANEEAEVPRGEVTCSRSLQNPLWETSNCFLPPSPSLPWLLPPYSFPSGLQEQSWDSWGDVRDFRGLEAVLGSEVCGWSACRLPCVFVGEGQYWLPEDPRTNLAQRYLLCLLSTP